MHKWVYSFGNGHADGSAAQRALLGGKGANLAEMSSLGLPVPPGFTLTTEVCNSYYKNGKTYPEGLQAQIDQALSETGKLTQRRFGDKHAPLLVSVRSGARVSMPGMMDTVLNLGLNDTTVEALAAQSGDLRFAYDSYRRFIQMYADVVLGVDHHEFEECLHSFKDQRGYTLDTELTAEEWKTLVERYKALVQEYLGTPFPQDPMTQLYGAIGAVFDSWESPRAVTYRRLHGITSNWGTAVNVQAMVFGNMGEDSATGVAFTRNPSTGDNTLYGEFLINAQGEDVVAGLRTPQTLTERARQETGCRQPALETVMPESFAAFQDICRKLEQHYKDMQDIEFTIERGTLWILQTRSGKRTARAALKIAVDIAKEGLISKEEAILRISPSSLDQLLHPTIDPSAPRQVLCKGLPASPGAACGEIVFSSEHAEHLKSLGKKVILVRIETSPEDIHGMHAAEGILTARGGMTSHAAVVARGMGKPCVSGAESLRIDTKKKTLSVKEHVFAEGDLLTIDGSTGEVLLGQVAMRQPDLSGDFKQLMGWADSARRMQVRANAETPEDAQTAVSFGAEGIGLCRTEHMFFEGSRIAAMQEMVLAESEAGRRAALGKLLPMQRQDFVEIFKIMEGKPVTIRLLDPPLHEFLPKTPSEMAELAKNLGVSPQKIKERSESLHEFNPMLGHRGCRLLITYPEIVEMQAQAIFEAALETHTTLNRVVALEIMVPLVGMSSELDFVAQHINQVAQKILKGVEGITYAIGTMIELPRAALQAGEIAKRAQFFSFGTNDLTQTTLGISRDDSARFLVDYQAKGILEQDPFVSLDQEGVGALIEMAAQRGRATHPNLKLGICGEHGGDPASISFCEGIGLDYVSCSPFRVPIARLAAAQATLLTERKECVVPADV